MVTSYLKKILPIINNFFLNTVEAKTKSLCAPLKKAFPKESQAVSRRSCRKKIFNPTEMVLSFLVSHFGPATNDPFKYAHYQSAINEKYYQIGHLENNKNHPFKILP